MSGHVSVHVDDKLLTWERLVELVGPADARLAPLEFDVARSLTRSHGEALAAWLRRRGLDAVLVRSVAAPGSSGAGRKVLAKRVERDA